MTTDHNTQHRHCSCSQGRGRREAERSCSCCSVMVQPSSKQQRRSGRLPEKIWQCFTVKHGELNMSNKALPLNPPPSGRSASGGFRTRDRQTVLSLNKSEVCGGGGALAERDVCNGEMRGRSHKVHIHFCLNLVSIAFQPLSESLSSPVSRSHQQKK